MHAVAFGLLAAAGLCLVTAVLALALAPLLVTRLAATASRPKLDRRATGPDRMRTLISAQQKGRRRQRSVSRTFVTFAITFAAAAVVTLLAGVAAYALGY